MKVNGDMDLKDESRRGHMLKWQSSREYTGGRKQNSTCPRKIYDNISGFQQYRIISRNFSWSINSKSSTWTYLTSNDFTFWNCFRSCVYKILMIHTLIVNSPVTSNGSVLRKLKTWYNFFFHNWIFSKLSLFWFFSNIVVVQ